MVVYSPEAAFLEQYSTLVVVYTPEATFLEVRGLLVIVYTPEATLQNTPTILYCSLHFIHVSKGTSKSNALLVDLHSNATRGREHV